jgi:hypothetical protein
MRERMAACLVLAFGAGPLFAQNAASVPLGSRRTCPGDPQPI